MIGPVLMALAVTALVLSSIRWPERALWQRRAVMLLVLVVSLLPWPIGVAHWLESVFAQLSVTSGLLALHVLARANGAPALISDTERRVLCLVLVLVAVPFYPLSLGALPMDPYAWGFGSFEFSTALLLVGLAAWVVRYYALCLLLVLAQVAYHFQLLHSDNLWDYLMDPALVVYALIQLLRQRRSGSAGEAGALG